jgi:hypothetical protein
VNSREQVTSQVLSLFFQSVENLLSKKLLQGEFFLQDDGFFSVNDPQLEYLAPSLSRLNDYEEYLKETLPIPSFQLHFDLKYHDSKMILMVGVDMALKEKDAYQEGDEIANPLRSWDRLFKLPSIDYPCAMIDVWHIDDALAPRIVAQTKYADVVPRFRHIVKKSKKKLGSEAEPGAAEEGKEEGAKTGEQHDDEDDHAGDDDEEEFDNGSGALVVRKMGQGKKRKRNKENNKDNEESMAPVSPDTHVNSPSAGFDANGNELGRSMIVVTYPKEHHESNRKTWLRSDPGVHHYRKPKLKKKNREVSNLVTFSSFNSVGGSSFSALEGQESLQKNVPIISHKLNSASRNSLNSNSLIDGGNELNVPQQQKAELIGRHISATSSNSISPSTVVQGMLEHKKTKLVVTPNGNDFLLDGWGMGLDPVHPVLKALAAEVDKDMTNFGHGNAKENQAITASKAECNVVSNASMYLSSNSTVPEYKYLTRSIIEQVSRQHLLSDQLQQKLDIYSKDLTWYGPTIKNGLDAHKSQQNQQRLLLSFEPQQLLADHPLEDRKNVIRDEEIEIGLKLSAKDALVQSCRGKESCSRIATRTWLMEEVIGKRPTEAALESDRNRLAGRILSYIDMISSYLQAKGHKKFKELTFGRKWLTLAQYAAVVSNDAGNMVEKSHAPPDLSISNTDSCFSVPACYVSEWIYRDFHPVSAPKPVDYVVICPSSPKEWLGSLTLSYVQAFKSMYTQCRLGDQLPIELKHLVNNPSVQIGDSTHGLMLVNCSTSQDDTFQTYRKAGEMLRSLIGPNAKKNQAFGRCAIANVIYLVAPFRRGDVKHEMWIRGAVARGLGFDLNSKDIGSTGWQGSIVFEIIFLDELYRVGLTASSLGGFALMGDCMALYDKVYEKINLQPCSNTTVNNTNTLTENDRARFICERIFHLANGETTHSKDGEDIEPGEEQSNKNNSSIQAHVGYTISTDGRWLLICFADRLGSVLESHIIDLHDGNTQEDIEIGWNKGFLFAWERILSFYALFGEKGVLILSKKEEITQKEQETWSNLAEKTFGEKDLDPNLSKYASLIHQFCLVEVIALRTVVERPQLSNHCASQRVQIRYQEDGLRQTRITTPMQSLHGREPVRKSFIVFPMDANSKVRSGMIVTTPHEKLPGTRVTAMLNTRCFGGYCKKREELTFRVDCIKTFGPKEEKEEEEETKVKWTMKELLENFVDLSWLTIHPVTLERASPWPLHLATVQVMETNVNVLGQQLEQR